MFTMIVLPLLAPRLQASRASRSRPLFSSIPMRRPYYSESTLGRSQQLAGMRLPVLDLQPRYDSDGMFIPQDVEHLLRRQPALVDISKRFQHILGKEYENVAVPQLANPQTTGAGPVTTQLLMGFNKRRAVNDALASISFSTYTSRSPALSISEIVQTTSTITNDRLILEPMPYPVTTLTSLFAATGLPSFDPTSLDARIQKAVRGGSLQGPRTLSLWSGLGCEECQAFIGFTNAISKNDEQVAETAIASARDILQRSPNVLLKMCPACGAPRELTNGGSY